MIKKLLSPSLLFIFGQTLVGGLNYLYQVYVTRVIDNVQFGVWSVWFAQFSVTLLVALWLQSLTSLDGPKQLKFRFLGSKTFKTAALFLLSVLSLLSVATSEMWLFNITGWLWAILQALYFGRALARQQLRLAATSMVAGALFKFSFPLFLPSELSCYLGVLFGPLATVFILAAFEDKKVAAITEEKVKAWTPRGLLAALLLAVATAWIPQMDLLMANRLLGAEQMGLFAKVALVYKAFFFFILILAQLLLSKQVQNEGAGLTERHFLVIPGIGVVIAGLAAVIFPESIAPASWVALSILHISTLTFLFLCLQLEVSKQKLFAGFLILGLLAIEALGVLGWGASLGLAIEGYFGFVLVLEALLCAILALLKPSLPTKNAPYSA